MMTKPLSSSSDHGPRPSDVERGVPWTTLQAPLTTRPPMHPPAVRMEPLDRRAIRLRWD